MSERMCKGVGRNDEIRRSIEEFRKPVLPFELTLAKKSLKGFCVDQSTLTDRMSDAMDQSSETWHDNAPAEMVRDDSINLSAAAEGIISVINKADVFDYEADPEEGATMGSLVGVKYRDDKEPYTFFITGISRELTPEIAEQIDVIEGVTVVTVGSPIGKAILGKTEGDLVNFSAPNGRNMSFTVESVRQVNYLQPATLEL